jgi:hypothetical protein
MSPEAPGLGYERNPIAYFSPIGGALKVRHGKTGAPGLLAASSTSCKTAMKAASTFGRV